MKREKNILRKEILRQRQSLSETEWQTKSNLICDRLINSSLVTQANTIFAYFSFRKEADLSSLFFLNKGWAFPSCVGQSLIWNSWQPGKPLIQDKYGIKTPLKTAPIVSISSADLILVPTVSCDQKGYRLGYGGGFYDRMLAASQGLKIPTVGVVFDIAYVAELPRESWDIKLDFVCTETQLLNHTNY